MNTRCGRFKMKFKDAVEICRPINDIMGGLTVIIGILNTRTGVSPDKIIINIVLGMITYFFLAASGMIIKSLVKASSDAEETQRIDLIDIHGRTVRTIDIVNSNSVTIHRDNLPSGIYFIRIHSDDTYVKKVIIK